MRFIDFPEANLTLAPAVGADADGTPVRISCFELEAGDLERLAAGGKVWLWVVGSARHRQSPCPPSRRSNHHRKQKE